MPFFQSDGLKLAYIDEGEGDPILLHHGYASSVAVNWVSTGWVELLKKDGRRVIAIDARGHGESDKPTDPAAYGSWTMAADANNLLDHLGLGPVDVMGYSMGARVATYIGLNHKEKVRRLILAGLAARILEVMGDPEVIASAMDAPTLADVTHERGAMFRKFADRNNADLKALAACMRAPRRKIEPAEIAKLTMPVLIAVGTEDTVAGSPQKLAALLPDAEILDIPGRDHMRAVGDKVFKEGVLDFLRRR